MGSFSQYLPQAQSTNVNGHLSSLKVLVLVLVAFGKISDANTKMTPTKIFQNNLMKYAQRDGNVRKALSDDPETVRSDLHFIKSATEEMTRSKTTYLENTRDRVILEIEKIAREHEDGNGSF